MYVFVVPGLLIYFAYGFWKSREKLSEDQEVILYEIADNWCHSQLLQNTYAIIKVILDFQ